MSTSPAVTNDAQMTHFHVNELASDKAGPVSPFGPDANFPWPLEKIRYAHPRPEDRPKLAGDR